MPPEVPKYLNPLTDEKPGAQEKSPVLQRERALSPEGVSALLRRCRGARGSRRANESKTRRSTPRGDVGTGTGTAPPPVTGREEPQGPGAFWSALGKSQSGEKRSTKPPRQTKNKTPPEKVLPQNRGGNKGSDGGTGVPVQEAELTSPPSEKGCTFSLDCEFPLGLSLGKSVIQGRKHRDVTANRGAHIKPCTQAPCEADPRERSVCGVLPLCSPGHKPTLLLPRLSAGLSPAGAAPGSTRGASVRKRERPNTDLLPPQGSDALVRHLLWWD